MSKLYVIHLVDSRKSIEEMQNYVNKVRGTRIENAHHVFGFGGNPDFMDVHFDAFVGTKPCVKVPSDCSFHILNSKFQCSHAIRYYIRKVLNKLKYENCDLSEIYFNIRDMDDEYDTEIMVKDLPYKDDNVGIVRYNYTIDGKESTYGRFNGDYFIKSWCEVGPKHTDHPKDVFEAIASEPHMIHRPFALFRGDVLENYVDSEGTYYPLINKAEDYQIMAATYVICLAELDLGIKVCGSVNIANYVRSVGQMSQGDCNWILREEEFRNNIAESAQAIQLNYSYENDILNEMVNAFLHVTVAERCIGNIKSMIYHLNQEGKLNGI